MTPFELADAALAETNPAARSALAEVGANRAGNPLAGLLGWLPIVDLVDVCRAIWLAHHTLGTECFTYPSERALLMDVALNGAWLRPRELDAQLIDAAVIAWSRQRGKAPMFKLLEVWSLQAQEKAA